MTCPFASITPVSLPLHGTGVNRFSPGFRMDTPRGLQSCKAKHSIEAGKAQQPVGFCDPRETRKMCGRSRSRGR